MITEQDFEAILRDPTKRIEGDIIWYPKKGSEPALEFRLPICSEPGWPLFVRAWWNPQSEKLTYTIVYRGTGRIIGLDMGRGHDNPTGEHLADVHKHLWSDQFRDKKAYTPPDITAPWDHPIDVWKQFCEEISVVHTGVMHPPFRQEELSI